jgi:hypothetical protein
MPMKPTRALEISERTPSSIPIPARPQHRADRHLLARDPLRRHPLERGLDLDRLRREVLRRLVGEEQGDLVDELAEVDRRRRLVPEIGELVLDERVLDLGDAAGCDGGAHAT